MLLFMEHCQIRDFVHVMSYKIPSLHFNVSYRIGFSLPSAMKEPTIRYVNCTKDFVDKLYADVGVADSDLTTPGGCHCRSSKLKMCCDSSFSLELCYPWPFASLLA